MWVVQSFAQEANEYASIGGSTIIRGAPAIDDAVWPPQ